MPTTPRPLTDESVNYLFSVGFFKLVDVIYGFLLLGLTATGTVAAILGYPWYLPVLLGAVLIGLVWAVTMSFRVIFFILLIRKEFGDNLVGITDASARKVIQYMQQP